MKNQELFNKTISILVNAYLNNTLEHTNCYACAVGNIIADTCGYKFKQQIGLSETYYTGLGKLTFEPALKFNDLLVHCITADIEEPDFNENQKAQLQQTGYSFTDLINIESAFERPSEYFPFSANKKTEDQYVFDGLMTVCDCLMEIHEATTEEAKQAKELFIKA